MEELFWQNKELINLPEEIWVDAYGYDGCYSVSNLGRVKSEERRVLTFRGDRRVRARILSQGKCKDGRLTVNLSMNDVKKTETINQLIYYSFYPEKLPNKGKSEVYHKNKKDKDNRLVNLGHNKVKGKSYKISMNLGNVKHLEKARKALCKYTKDTATIIDGIVIERKCRDCHKLLPQIKFSKKGCNVCNRCRYIRHKNRK